jgi:hypothetical protein
MKTWSETMSTIPTKILTTFAVATAIAAGTLAVSSTADARTPRHHYFSYSRPYVYQRTYRRGPFYPDYYGGYSGGSYAYHPEYRRAPIYNHDDATKFSRQLMGHGD